MNKTLLPLALLALALPSHAQSAGTDLEAAMDAASAMAQSAASAPKAQALNAARAGKEEGEGACVLPYVGLTQKGKWAVDLDGYRYEKTIAQTRVNSLSIFDFSPSAQDARQMLSGAEQRLQLRERAIQAEVKAAGLSIDVHDLTIRKLAEGQDYRYDETCAAAAPNF